MIKKLFDNRNLTEQELTKKLYVVLASICGIIACVFIITLAFGPKIGYFFGLLSIHRNEKEKVPVIKPNPPFFIKLPKSVNQYKVTLTGYAPAGSTVRLYVNGPEKAKTISGGDGMFSLVDVPLNAGKNTLSAKLTDAHNIESDKTSSFYITVDTEKPKIELTNIKEGDTIKNLDKRIIILGKVNEQAEIKINGKVAILKPDLTFEFILGAEEGEVKIKIEVIDEAGNKKEEELKVRYQKSSL